MPLKASLLRTRLRKGAESSKLKAKNGLLISFDGLDSSGKATQAARLRARLELLGWNVSHFETPDYSTPSGKELKLLLQGKKGNWNLLRWQEKMGYFATNRKEHRDEVIAAQESGNIVIYDRYVPSSLAFIAVEALNAKEVDSRRKEIYNAVRDLEYGKNNMPHEDVSIFLDMPPIIAETLLSKRKRQKQEEDEYTDHRAVQERLYQEYVWMCKNDPDHFIRIPCVSNEKLFSIAEVSEQVWEVLTGRYPHLKSESSSRT